MTDNDGFVRIGLREVYDAVTRVESSVANLSNNAKHAEDWRVQADKDIKALDKRLDDTVTRRELYALLGACAALISAASPFLAQLYGG